MAKKIKSSQALEATEVLLRISSYFLRQKMDQNQAGLFAQIMHKKYPYSELPLREALHPQHGVYDPLFLLPPSPSSQEYEKYLLAKIVSTQGFVSELVLTDKDIKNLELIDKKLIPHFPQGGLFHPPHLSVKVSAQDSFYRLQSIQAQFPQPRKKTDLKDLVVTSKGTQVFLFSKKQKLEVLPQNIRSTSHQKFFTELTHLRWYANLAWDWRGLSSLKNLPQVRYKNIILWSPKKLTKTRSLSFSYKRKAAPLKKYFSSTRHFSNNDFLCFKFFANTQQWDALLVQDLNPFFEKLVVKWSFSKKIEAQPYLRIHIQISNPSKQAHIIFQCTNLAKNLLKDYKIWNFEIQNFNMGSHTEEILEAHQQLSEIDSQRVLEQLTTLKFNTLSKEKRYLYLLGLIQEYQNSAQIKALLPKTHMTTSVWGEALALKIKQRSLATLCSEWKQHYQLYFKQINPLLKLLAPHPLALNLLIHRSLNRSYSGITHENEAELYYILRGKP